MRRALCVLAVAACTRAQPRVAAEVPLAEPLLIGHSDEVVASEPRDAGVDRVRTVTAAAAALVDETGCRLTAVGSGAGVSAQLPCVVH